MFSNLEKIEPGKQVYFASDLHLGIPDHASSLQRERRFIKWVDTIKPNLQALFLLGDLFDFWFEYKKAVPKHFVRLLGKLAELTDSGIPVYFFEGNHDAWMRDYFETELHIPVFSEPQTVLIGGKTFMLGHGDGLGPGDHGYKRMKRVFRSPLFRWLFRQLHPDFGLSLGQRLSFSNKLISGIEDRDFKGEFNEWIILHCKNCLLQRHYDYFVFGHRHLPLDFPLTNGSKYINTGDWITHFSYAVFDGQALRLQSFFDDVPKA